MRLVDPKTHKRLTIQERLELAMGLLEGIQQELDGDAQDEQADIAKDALGELRLLSQAVAGIDTNDRAGGVMAASKRLYQHRSYDWWEGFVRTIGAIRPPEGTDGTE